MIRLTTVTKGSLEIVVFKQNDKNDGKYYLSLNTNISTSLSSFDSLITLIGYLHNSLDHVVEVSNITEKKTQNELNISKECYFDIAPGVLKVAIPESKNTRNINPHQLDINSVNIQFFNFSSCKDEIIEKIQSSQDIQRYLNKEEPKAA